MTTPLPLIFAFALFFALVAAITTIHLQSVRNHNRRVWPMMKVGCLGLRIARAASLLGAICAFVVLISQNVGRH